MKHIRILVLCTLLMGCSQPGKQQGTNQYGKPISPDAPYVDSFLQEFSKATAELDIDKMTDLFLPPDDTQAGINRREHLLQAQREWARAKEEGKKIAISFEKTYFDQANESIRTNMVVISPREKTERIPIEFEITLTDNGWRIVSMRYLSND